MKDLRPAGEEGGAGETADGAEGPHLTHAISAAGTSMFGSEAEAPLEDDAADDAAGSVLVIDDDPDARELISRLLRREGYRVKTAADGNEGLRMARDVRPCAITLDVLMPTMDGWAVLTALKSEPALADIPVVMVTITSDRTMAYALGAADFLTKPIERDRMLSVLKRFDYDCRLVPCRALVVDDDAANRKLLRNFLEREHWIVVEAEDGAEALAAVERTPPDLILLDLMMPTMDGFEVAERLHRDERWRNIPVVVVTAKDLTEEDRRRLNGSVMRVVQKTGGPGGVVQAIKDLTERRPLPGGLPALPVCARPEAPDPPVEGQGRKQLDPDVDPESDDSDEREMAREKSADDPEGP